MPETNVSAAVWNTLDWLKSTRTVAIPVYQRDYRWDQVTCERLLSDIRQVGEADDESAHFIGSILTTPADNGDLTLVDGQQRVTTIMLIVAAVRDHAAGSDPAIAAAAADILLRPGNHYVSRLRAHERYEHVLRGLMTGSGGFAGDSTMEANYLALMELMLPNWSAVWRGLHRLEHVLISLGASADAQQIFESLNSTGARLSDDELIHNYIHMGRGHHEQVDLERRTWQPIELATSGATRQFWRDYLVWSSDKQPDFEGEFGVYQSFRRRYPHPKVDLTPEVYADWVQHAGWYGRFLDPDAEPDGEVRKQFTELQEFGALPRPLMLGMYGHWATARIDKATFLESLGLLQTMLVRQAVVGTERSLWMIGSLCRDLRTNGYPMEAMVRRTPEDPAIRLALSYGSLPHAGYVLRRLQQPPPEAADLQIEHIHPQAPDDMWSGDGGATTWGQFDNDARAEFRTVLNTIGNLTLLEARYNQGAGNRSFVVKAERYYRRSQVAETREIGLRSAWNYEAIKARTTELTDAFLDAWPRAGGAPLDTADLVRVVELPLTPVRGYPDLFEYAVCGSAFWGDVRNVKQLLVHVADELWSRDPERLRAAKYGGHIVAERETGRSYAQLQSGRFLYAGWANRFLLEVAQEWIREFALDDLFRVKLIESVRPADR